MVRATGRRTVGHPATESSDLWVTASKICARKRPRQFPVRDCVVRGLLGLTQYDSYKIDWQVFRTLIGDRGIVVACDTAIAAAHEAADGRRLDVDRDRLRVLDTALWMYPKRLRRP